MRRQPLDPQRARHENPPAMPSTVILERPDPDGSRWGRALNLLLAAGQENKKA